MSELSSDRRNSLAGPGPLATRRFGLRFVDSTTEAEYSRWRVATAMPFAQMGFLGSAPSWAGFLVAVWIFTPASLPTAGPAIIGWVLFLVAMTGLTVWRPAQRWIMPLAALANCLAGFLVAWLLHDVTTVSMTHAARAGVMSGGVLIVMYFGFAIFRIPPSLAIAGVTPYLGLALLYLYGDARAGVLETAEAGAFAAIVLIAYSGGVFVCLVIEWVQRRSFAKDQIIQMQQRQLANSRDAIRRYVPPAVAQRIIRGESASVEAPLRRRVTILFCDIVGFTDIADRVEPEVITQVLSDYLSAMSSLVDTAGGTVNEFAGDGLMALFGAPDEVAPMEQARRSIRAALAMQAKMQELSESWRVLGLGKALQVRIGINTGMASVGSYGSQGRMTYTAVGLVTNIAARVESAAEPGQILISETTYQLVRDEADCTPRGGLDCKGVHFPVLVYAVRGTLDSSAPLPAVAVAAARTLGGEASY